LGRPPGRRLYMGIDIAEGSPASGKRPLYAVVIVDEEGRTIVSQGAAPLSRVIRLAWDYRPEKVALDNVLELAPSARDLEKVLGMFPPESVIVQVTLGEDGVPRSLREKARERGLDVGRGRLSPTRTAYLAALLAAMGEGVPVRVVEEKTVIVVSKARTPKGGGYSQRRLQRRVRASVHQAAMRVREALDRAGLDYDMSYRKSVGGLESAVFTVYAPREKLYGVVRPHRGLDYMITIRPVYKTRLQLPGEEKRSLRPVIVGLDPGITTGLAIIDLDGRVLLLESGKGLDRGSILEIVSRYGRPIIVAVDVAGVPDAARKLAAQFGAAVYSPGEDLSSAEKRELATRALGGSAPEDTHQRDALAAAYKAYLSLRQKLEHVESQLRRMGLDVDLEAVKESVVRGATLAQALERAIEEKLGSLEEAGEEKPRHARKPPAGPPSPDEGRLEALQAENISLRRRVRQLEKELEALRREVEEAKRSLRAELRRDPELRSLRGRIERLEALVRSLEEEKAALEEEARRLARIAVRLGRGELVLLRPVPNLTVRSLRRSEDEWGSLVPGEIVYVAGPGVVEEEAFRLLAEAMVLGVVVEKGARVPGRLARKYMVPVVPEDRLPAPGVFVERGLYLAGAEAREVLEEERRRLEEERRASLDLERLIEEYRSRRAGRPRKG